LLDTDELILAAELNKTVCLIIYY